MPISCQMHSTDIVRAQHAAPSIPFGTNFGVGQNILRNSLHWLQLKPFAALQFPLPQNNGMKLREFLSWWQPAPRLRSPGTKLPGYPQTPRWGVSISPSRAFETILFGTNFGVEHWNFLSLRERARVRGGEQKHYFLHLILSFSRREKGPRRVARQPKKQPLPLSCDQ